MKNRNPIQTGCGAAANIAQAIREEFVDNNWETGELRSDNMENMAEFLLALLSMATGGAEGDGEGLFGEHYARKL